MNPTNAEREIDRIERELDSANPPGGKPPMKRNGGLSGGGQSGKSGNRSLDAVMVGAVLLIGIAGALVAAENMSRDQRIKLTAGAFGSAVGLLVGYGVGKFRP